MAVSTPDTQRMVAYQATDQGAVRRFRNPAQFDVLSGRGGNVNKHLGNIYFREIVKTRKMEYNRAKKDRKAEICREVISHVAEKGGTFLVKENETFSSAFWTEQSDDRTMAKVSQALREGAPKIRETLGGSGTTVVGGGTTRKRVYSVSARGRHHHEAADPAEIASNDNDTSKRVRLEFTVTGKQYHPAPPSQVTPPLTTATAPASVTTAMPPLALSSSSLLTPPHPKTLQRSESSISLTGIIPDGMDTDNMLLEDFVNPFDSTTTPPLAADYEPLLGQHSLLPPPALPSKLGSLVQRSHSLCLSDISAHPNYLEDDFINPFDNDEDGRYNFQYTFSRQASNASDMGGLGSLLRNETDHQQHQTTTTVDRRPSWQEPDYYNGNSSSSSSGFESVVVHHHPFHFSPALIVP